MCYSSKVQLLIGEGHHFTASRCDIILEDVSPPGTELSEDIRASGKEKPYHAIASHRYD